MARKRFAVAVIVVMTLAVSSWAADPAEPDWAGTWQAGATMAAGMSRFDGAYYAPTGLVYFLGARLTDNSTDGSILTFNPVTGVYGDTGVDMPIPISNYTVNVLTDATGTGFYTFCGRTAGGTQNFVTQVYYPATNTAAQLAGDDFPGDATHTCTSALNVVFNNKVYLAGGFTGTTMSNWTYVFDPMAASGSRWTRLSGADLATPRAYIMGAVVDGLIYAIGGANDDGAGGLANLAIVERLDPAAGTPSWNDAAVADLPEVCSSSRAFGFDAASSYQDPVDHTPLASKIISGCGVWATPTVGVYAYTVSSNSWAAFPALAVARRDIAAEFLPLASAPALWVWGGYDVNGGNSMTTTSEFFALYNPVPVELQTFTAD